MDEISPKQLNANRQNAKKGGVKTEAGKGISKYNALSHGILSKQTIIERGDESEDIVLFQKIRAKFFTEINPVGILEIMQTDLILSDYWRLQRVMKAERAIIEAQRNGHVYDRLLQRSQDAVLYEGYASASFYDRIKTVMGCQQLLHDLELIRSIIEEEGLPLGEEHKKLLMNIGLAVNFPKTKELWLFNLMLRGKEDLKIKEKNVPNLVKRTFEIIEELKKVFTISLQFAEKRESEGDRISLDTQFLPAENDLQRIQRYEAHLRRNLMQALHELQRLQAIRLGNSAPATAALDVTINSENGFVS